MPEIPSHALLSPQLPMELVPCAWVMNQSDLAAAIAVHLDALYNLAVWLARDATDAQALVQGTARQALQTLPQHLSGTKLRLRLFTTLWEISRQQHAGSDDGLGDIRPGKAVPDKRHLFFTLDRTDIDAALRQLPEALRMVLILTEMEGCSPEEVAEVVSWSSQDVQATLAEARHRLAQILRERVAATVVRPTPKPEETL